MMDEPADRGDRSSLDRRQWLRRTAGAGLGLALATGCSRPALRTVETSVTPLVFPGKVPMRVVNERPPNLETPWRFYRQDITPTEAFFVRWHLQFVPTTVDLRT